MNLIPDDSGVICLESVAFYKLVDEIVERLSDKLSPTQRPWINDKEAMQLLGISSRTTLQKYRDEGLIRFSQPSPKVILYDRASIMDYIDRHAKDTLQ